MGIFKRLVDIFKAQEKILSYNEVQSFESERELNILPENIASFCPKILTLRYGREDIGSYFDLRIDEKGVMHGFFCGNEQTEIKIQLSENQLIDLCFILAHYNFFEIKCEENTSLQSYTLYAKNQIGKENSINQYNRWVYFQPIQNMLFEDIITCLQVRKYWA